MRVISPEDAATARAMTNDMVQVLRLARDRRERPDPSGNLWEAFAACQDEYAVEDLGGGYARITPRGRRLLGAYRQNQSEGEK